MTILAAVDQGGRIVGTLAFRRESETTGHLRGMAVDPVLQGKGVAQSLLERALHELAGLGCSQVTLKTTSPLQRAIHFYEKNGFRKSGKVSDFFGMPATEYFLELHPATDREDVPRPTAFSPEDDAYIRKNPEEFRDVR